MFKSGESLVFGPVGGDALVDDAGTVLLNGILGKSFAYHFCNSGTLLLSKQLIAKLDYVIPKCVLDYLIDAECYLVNEFLLCLSGQLLYLL